jgi:putative transposase
VASTHANSSINRALSRKKRGSRNAARAKRRLAKLHARIANIRKDVTHKATTALAKGFRRIGIEDLNVQGMARNRATGAIHHGRRSF